MFCPEVKWNVKGKAKSCSLTVLYLPCRASISAVVAAPSSDSCILLASISFLVQALFHLSSLPLYPDYNYSCHGPIPVFFFRFWIFHLWCAVRQLFKDFMDSVHDFTSYLMTFSPYTSQCVSLPATCPGGLSWAPLLLRWVIMVPYVARLHRLRVTFRSTHVTYTPLRTHTKVNVTQTSYERVMNLCQSRLIRVSCAFSCRASTFHMRLPSNLQLACTVQVSVYEFN